MDNSELYKHIFDDDELYLVDTPQFEGNSIQEPEVTYETKSEPKEVKESVIESTTPTQEKDPEVVKKEIIQFKGSNNKGVAIIVNYDNEEFINSADEAFLLKILAAVQLSNEDVAIINKANNLNLTLEGLNELNCRSCLVFGVNALQGNNPNYRPQAINNITTLFCSNLTSIQSNVEEKKLLWSALQKIFLN